MSQIDVYILLNVISQKQSETNTICVVFYSLNFLKPVHVQSVPLLPQYAPNNDVEQSDIPSGLLLMERLFLPHQLFNTSCAIPLTSNLSRILVIVTLVGGGIPDSTLQCRTSTTVSTFQ